jgi:hypothetical protein
MKELDNINESFASAGMEAPFKVPTGYFDSLPSRIQERCVSTSVASNKQTISIWQVIKSQLTLASGFAAFAIIAFVAFYYLKPTEQTIVLSNDDYIEIIQKNIYEYDEYRLAKESNGLIHDDSLKNILKDEMIQYLLDENVDYVTLIEQY